MTRSHAENSKIENDRLKPIPDSLEALEKELNGTQDEYRFKSLLSARISRTNNRYTNRAVMFLVGESGAGKSSTINHLFGNTYAKTSASQSCTQDTTEWYVESDVNEWLIGKLKLSIVDSPGFNDTSGATQDSVNMACIKEFFDSYPSAAIPNKDQGLFPNFVLLTVNGSNSRYKGMESNFVKSLRALSKVGVVDQENPNVLIVITHAIVAGLDEETFNQRNKTLGDDISGMCSAYFGFKPNYVFLENKPESYHLPRVKGKEWLTILPNKTEQPANLFKALMEVAGNKDPIGKLCISHFLGIIEHTELTKGHCVTSHEVTSNAELYQIFNEHHKKTSLEIFADSYIEDEDLPIGKAKDVMILVTRLQNRGLDSRKEMKKMDYSIVLSKVNMLLNSTQVDFLNDLCAKKADYIKLDVSVGQSYNILTDSKVTKQIYQLKENSCFYHNFEFVSNMDLGEEDTTSIKAKTFDSPDDYVKHSLSELNIVLDDCVLDLDQFLNSKKDGYNFTNAQVYDFVVEASLFSLKLRENSKVPSEYFIKDVQQLPEIYNKDDEENANKFKKFFQCWGSHVILEQKIGGYVVGDIERKTVPNEKIESAIYEKLSSITDKGMKLGTIPASVMNAALRWKGGDKQEHVKFFKEMNKEQWRKWKKSLPQEAVALDSYQLEPIHEPVKKIDLQKARAVEKALEDLSKVYFHDDIGATRCESRNRVIRNVFRIFNLPYIPMFFKNTIALGYLAINYKKFKDMF